MQLLELAQLINTSRLIGIGSTMISGLALDSRRVCPGNLFICVSGFVNDGHQFASAAIARGATALLVERELPLSVPQLIVPDSRYAAAILANHFYSYPSRQLKMIGVTGTNGKTTTTMILHHILAYAGFKTGLMGTIRTQYADIVETATQTTVDSVTLQQTLRRMVEAQVQYGIMEVSSHALDQGRVIGVDFGMAIFTNLTQDHLDYHLTMEAYLAAKSLLFSRLGNASEMGPTEKKVAILNADDPASAYLSKLTAAEVITYGIDQVAHVQAQNIHISPLGTTMFVHTFAGDCEVTLPLLGKFNVYNTLAAISAALLQKIPLETITSALTKLPTIDGRLESVEEGQSFSVIVDYAHTPDGLLNVLQTIQEFAKGRIITVFGCGGERDRTKRPLMGQIAAQYSQYTILTSDNPRSEDPLSILLEIEVGLITAGASSGQYEMFIDRRVAIHKAVELAQPGDVVLIAGKGHEREQIIGGITTPFDDRLEARAAIKMKGASR